MKIIIKTKAGNYEIDFLRPALEWTRIKGQESHPLVMFEITRTILEGPGEKVGSREYADTISFENDIFKAYREGALLINEKITGVQKIS